MSIMKELLSGWHEILRAAEGLHVRQALSPRRCVQLQAAGPTPSTGWGWDEEPFPPGVPATDLPECPCFHVTSFSPG